MRLRQSLRIGVCPLRASGAPRAPRKTPDNRWNQENGCESKMPFHGALIVVLLILATAASVATVRHISFSAWLPHSAALDDTTDPRISTMRSPRRWPLR